MWCTVIGEGNQKLDFNIFMLRKEYFRRYSETIPFLILVCKTTTTNMSLQHEYSYCRSCTVYQRESLLTLRFFISSWCLSFSKNDWKKSYLSTCLGATQTASMSAPAKRFHFFCYHWKTLSNIRTMTRQQKFTFTVYFKPVRTTHKYFATNICYCWRGKILWVEEKEFSVECKIHIELRASLTSM